MPIFVTFPSGSLFNLFSIGGVKAVETGLLTLGVGTGAEPPILDYFPCPSEVAVAWRNALTSAIEAHSHRPNRPFKQIDWLDVAAGADLQWATSQGCDDGSGGGGGRGPGAPSAAAAAAPTSPSSAPARRHAGPAKQED